MPSKLSTIPGGGRVKILNLDRLESAAILFDT